MVSFDARQAGTSASAWLADDRMATRPELDWDGVSGVLVVAAHPDDETLGAGGLIAEAERRGLPVRIVVATDGAASQAAGIAERRSAELAAAIRLLAPTATVEQLGLPDGRTDEHREELRAALAERVEQLPPDTLLVAPWSGDGHRDHRVVGETVADGRRRQAGARVSDLAVALGRPVQPRDPVGPARVARRRPAPQVAAPSPCSPRRPRATSRC